MASSRVLAIVMAATLSSVALSACPNLCSGHGTCKDDNRCECDKDYGAGDEVFGDCSAMFCPYEVRHFIATCTCWVTCAAVEATLQAALVSSQSRPAPSYSPAPNQGYMHPHTRPPSLRLTTPHHFGFQIAWVDDPNQDGHYHSYRECAGKGLCDRDTGEVRARARHDGPPHRKDPPHPRSLILQLQKSAHRCLPTRPHPFPHLCTFGTPS